MLCKSATLAASLIFATPAMATLTWHSVQTYGGCSLTAGCYPPNPFDASLGVLRSVQVDSSAYYGGTYYYNNNSDVDDVLTFSGQGQWYNWDSYGVINDTFSITLSANRSGTFNIEFGGEDHHIEAGYLGGYSDPSNFTEYSYFPEVDVSYGFVESAPGTAFWTIYDSDYNFGTSASVALTYNYTTGTVPEPATWAMVLTGFGVIGGAMRYHRKRTVSFASHSPFPV